MDELDLKILRAAKRGHQGSVSIALSWMKSKLCGAVRSSGIPGQEMEDLLQDLVLVVYSCIQKYDPSEGEFDDYVMGAAWNAINTARRRNGKVALSLHGTLPDSPSREIPVPDIAAAREARSTLASMLAKLPPENRELVQQAYGIRRPMASVVRIASRAGMSRSRVQRVIQESIETLRGMNDEC